MAVLRALGFPSLLPAAITVSTASPPVKSLHRSHSVQFLKRRLLGSSQLLQLALVAFPAVSGATMAVTKASAAQPVTEMATTQIEQGVRQEDRLPDLLTEFMVDMKCEGCVKSVRTKLEPLDGVKSVDVDLGNQVVRVFGSVTVKNLTDALAESGRKARLIGQGLAENFTISAAVAEFKGPEIHGVVRFAQVSMELARVEGSFSGLSPGSHGWSINEFGDLTRGAASTGPIFNQSTSQCAGPDSLRVGDLGVLEVNSAGQAEYLGTKEMLRVGDLVGRAVVVYGDSDKSRPGIAAAVIARSAGVGENYKQLCSCDGTVIWESTNSDYVKA